MGRKRLWLLAPVVVVAVMATAVFGLSAAFAETGAEQAAPFAEGTVLHYSFLTGRGLDAGGPPDEVITEYWLRIGPDGEEGALRATLSSSDGVVLQEGVRRREDGYGTTYFTETGEVVQTPRPPQLPALMWTQDSASQELLAEGFEVIGETSAAGVPALVYEKRTPLAGSPPADLLIAAAIDLEEVVGIVRRVLVGSEPFGVDLGEETGYVLADGTEFIPYYRQITAWEVLEEAPDGTFEWSPPGAGEASQ